MMIATLGAAQQWLASSLGISLMRCGVADKRDIYVQANTVKRPRSPSTENISFTATVWDRRTHFPLVSNLLVETIQVATGNAPLNSSKFLHI